MCIYIYVYIYIYKLIKDSHVSQKPASPSLDQESKDCEAVSPTELQHRSVSQWTKYFIWILY